MRYLGFSGAIFLILLVLAIYLNSNLNYFASSFETPNYWLASNNPNLTDVSTFESFSKKIELYDFPTEANTFATVSYKDEFLNFQNISIPWSIVGNSLFSVSEKDGAQKTKLLTIAEAIEAVSKWRTEYTFEIYKKD